MFYKILLFLGFLTPSYVFGMNATTPPVVNQDLVFGDLGQLTSNASAVLSYGGTLELSGLMENSGSVPYNTTITLPFTGTSGGGENFNLGYTGITTSLLGGGCTITVEDLTFDQSSFNLHQGVEDVQIHMGATLTINGLCTEGDYQGNLSIPYTGCEKANQKKCISGQYSDNITVPVHVRLSTILSVKNTQDMNFGTVLMPSQSSTITVSPLGSYTSLGNLHFEKTDITPGRFEVTGLSNRVVNITLPGSTVLLNENNTSMTVDSFTSNPTGTLNLNTSGSGIIDVGATLHLNAGQQPGSYSGTYQVIVSY